MNRYISHLPLFVTCAMRVGILSQLCLQELNTIYIAKFKCAIQQTQKNYIPSGLLEGLLVIYTTFHSLQ